jgi:hypothetical protein
MSFFNPNTKIYSQVFYRFFFSFPNIIVFSTYFSILYDFLEFNKEMKKKIKNRSQEWVVLSAQGWALFA